MTQTHSIAFEPYREPVRTTLLRTGTIAVVGGLALGGGRMAHWPVNTLLFLWPSLGGHFVELAFLNGLRMWISPRRGVQVMARVIAWWVGGAGLTLAMFATARALGEPSANRWARWGLPRVAAIGGLGFIGVELIAHLVLHLRRVPNFYNGRG